MFARRTLVQISSYKSYRLVYLNRDLSNFSRRQKGPTPTPVRAYSEVNVRTPSKVEPVKRRAASISHTPSTGMKIHKEARCSSYPRTKIERFPVPDDKVPWNVEFEDYAPVSYTADSVLSGPVWADADLPNAPDSQIPEWNTQDKEVNRNSHDGSYQIVNDLPRNPFGRTGVCGRGLLGRWGPNHAADPIVTRWKRDENGEVCVDEEGKPILQFIAIQRRDNGQWALPGGMVSPGEHVSITLKREFGEETMNTLEVSDEERAKIEEAVSDLFHGGDEVYRGYVDDPRNTDNAWMETLAMNFHDANGDSVGKFKLHAGDDAVGVKWIDLSSALQLYASHVEFMDTVAKRHKASW